MYDIVALNDVLFPNWDADIRGTSMPSSILRAGFRNVPK